jgi:serine/threonine protein kinase
MAQATLQLKLAKSDVIDDRYVVVRKIGEGGCGSVYRCKGAKPSDPDVAVKVLENASDLPRFQREQKVMSGVRHPHVVRLLARGVHRHWPYLVMEFMDGGSVRDLLDARGRLSSEEAAWVLIQAVRGLRASRTIHRDLKPENLLIGLPKSAPRTAGLVVGDIHRGAVVKVADFGLARHSDPRATRLTNSGQVMGTPVYMSPEQCRNTRGVTVRSDIYALGVILYELVNGKPPFEASNAYDVMAKQCNDAPRYPRMDGRIKAICERCLAKQPKDRYPSLRALEQDLGAIAGIGAPQRDPLPIPWWAVLISMLILLGGMVWILRDQLLAALERWWLHGGS